MHLGFKTGKEHLSLGTNLLHQILRAKPICLLPPSTMTLVKTSMNFIFKFIPFLKKIWIVSDLYWTTVKSCCGVRRRKMFVSLIFKERYSSETSCPPPPHSDFIKEGLTMALFWHGQIRWLWLVVKFDYLIRLITSQQQTLFCSYLLSIISHWLPGEII